MIRATAPIRYDTKISRRISFTRVGSNQCEGARAGIAREVYDAIEPSARCVNVRERRMAMDVCSVRLWCDLKAKTIRTNLKFMMMIIMIRSEILKNGTKTRFVKM